VADQAGDAADLTERLPESIGADVTKQIGAALESYCKVIGFPIAATATKLKSCNASNYKSVGAEGFGDAVKRAGEGAVAVIKKIVEMLKKAFAKLVGLFGGGKSRAEKLIGQLKKAEAALAKKRSEHGDDKWNDSATHSGSLNSMGFPTTFPYASAKEMSEVVARVNHGLSQSREVLVEMCDGFSEFAAKIELRRIGRPDEEAKKACELNNRYRDLWVSMNPIPGHELVGPAYKSDYVDGRGWVLSPSWGLGKDANHHSLSYLVTSRMEKYKVHTRVGESGASHFAKILEAGLGFANTFLKECETFSEKAKKLSAEIDALDKRLGQQIAHCAHADRFKDDVRMVLALAKECKDALRARELLSDRICFDLEKAAAFVSQ
jgi:hypothetical protein